MVEIKFLSRLRGKQASEFGFHIYEDVIEYYGIKPDEYHELWINDKDSLEANIKCFSWVRKKGKEVLIIRIPPSLVKMFGLKVGTIYSLTMIKQSGPKP